jgi:flagellar biosynthesis/type III secretory pathway chaperone
MPPSSTKTSSPVLREFDQLIDNMIALQKREQQLILQRRTDDLAATTQSIEWMGLRMQSMEIEVKRELANVRQEQDHPQGRITEKLAQIRRLAQQNNTLLEHSLYFLQQLFQQVLDRDTPLHLYNLNGHAFTSDLGGGLLETRV